MKRIMELSKMRISEEQKLSVSFVGPRTIASINKEFVNHEGTTDIITFDYRDDELIQENDTVAELIIYPGMADIHSKKRKYSTFSSEIVLYLVHGVLHLSGEDDLEPVKRNRMRRKEREIMNKLKQEFVFENIIFKNKMEVI